MTAFQSIALGMMIFWTPSLLLLAILLWHVPMVWERWRQMSGQKSSWQRGLPSPQVEKTTIQLSARVDSEQKNPDLAAQPEAAKKRAF
jgi:hypothetical protein